MSVFDEPDEEVPDAIPWRERRRKVCADCASIIENPGDEACAARIREAAHDAKWEIRKVIADNLATLPEALANELTSVLAGDTNAMVRSATERSVARRTPASALSSSNPNVVQSDLDRLERRFGTEARQEAFRLAERSAFLHIRAAVHDIKNILTHFNLDIPLLLKVAPDSTTQMRLKRFEYGHQYLLKLVDMMEDYSRELNMKMQTEDLIDVVRESISAARDQVHNEGKDPAPVECHVKGPDSLSFPISRFHFAMVLTNLIKNAIQSHSISGTELRPGSVSIEVDVSADHVQITIADTGKGIAPDDLQKLCEFVPGGSSKPGGMGYGLPICRRYIEEHGGTLKLNSEQNKGTVVVITLPPQPVLHHE